MIAATMQQDAVGTSSMSRRHAAHELPTEFCAPSNDNDRGPFSRNPDVWHALIKQADALGVPPLANFARRAKLTGIPFGEFIELLKDACLSDEELARRCAAGWALQKRRLVKRLTIIRRRQARRRLTSTPSVSLRQHE